LGGDAPTSSSWGWRVARAVRPCPPFHSLSLQPPPLPSPAIPPKQGEPLLNVPSVAEAVRCLNEDVGIGARKITVSTVGVPGAIARFADLVPAQVTLAVSLHAPDQITRESIVPSAKAYPIDVLIDDCLQFYKTTGRRVSFEYTLLAGVNDKPGMAELLAEVLWRAQGGRGAGDGLEGGQGGARGAGTAHRGSWHVNLIPWNPVDESDFVRPSRNSILRFERALKARGVPCSVRVTRGLDAAAACGQLRNRHQREAVAEPVALE